MLSDSNTDDRHQRRLFALHTLGGGADGIFGDGLRDRSLTLDSPLRTSEIRWFRPGALPAHLVDWFSAGGRVGSTEERIDVYQLAGSSEIGVKLRNKRTLEFKLLLSNDRPVTLSPHVAGNAEEWVKFGCGDDVVDPTRLRERWISVEKVLLTRAYTVDEEGVARAVPALDTSFPGCEIELGSVHVAGIEAWTICIEASGPDDRRWGALEASLAAFRGESPFPADLELTAEESLSYPAWIARLGVGV